MGHPQYWGHAVNSTHFAVRNFIETTAPRPWHILRRHACDFCSRLTLYFILLFCCRYVYLPRPAFRVRPPTGVQVGRPDAGSARRCIPSWLPPGRAVYLRASIVNVTLRFSPPAIVLCKSSSGTPDGERAVWGVIVDFV